jgi:molecular chaperone GrpE
LQKIGKGKMARKSPTQPKDLENSLKRALADYANLKKRVATDQLQFVKYSNQELLNKLLPVIDNLSRAQNYLKDEGLKLALNQFLNVLESEGVKKINNLNQEFDPVLAECVEMVIGKKNKVVEIIKSGYTYHDKILRPAQVKVGKGE